MMKKIFLSMMVALISLSSFAQQPGGQRREFKPEDQATRQADRLKESVKLDDAQYKKIYDLFLAQAKKQQERMQQMQQAQNGGERPQFDREAMQKEREAQTAAIKEILTAEQFEAYQKAQQEQRGRFGQGGGRGQGGFGGGQGGPRQRPQGGQQ